MKKFLNSFLLLALVASLYSCSKDSDDDDGKHGEAVVSFRLTDGPGDFDAVYLDIEGVEVTMEGHNKVELTPIRPGHYDILEFRNGTDTLLMEANLPAGKFQQIRLKLGGDSYVVVDGQTHPLETPSGQQSGIKLNLHNELAAGGAYDIWIDFDAAKSIHQTGNGKFMLKPVIRAYSALTDGRIRGYVLPLAAMTTVYAINGADTFAAIPDAVTGYFRISGLPEAKYQVWLDAGVAPYQDMIIPDVQVSFGTEANIGTITLQP